MSMSVSISMSRGVNRQTVSTVSIGMSMSVSISMSRGVNRQTVSTVSIGISMSISISMSRGTRVCSIIIRRSILVSSTLSPTP